jgi:hypothetical protein
MKTSRLTTFYLEDLKERDNFGDLRIEGSGIFVRQKDVN